MSSDGFTGFAGIIDAPVVSITPDAGETILVQAFVVIVIGGVGSFPGAVLGGLIAGDLRLVGMWLCSGSQSDS